MALRLLVVRLGSLGDLVHTLPAVAALRRAHPDAGIDWLVDARHRELLDLVPVISSIVPLTRSTPAGWWQARAVLRPRRYDEALDFQGLLKSAALARLSGARQVSGFDKASLREPAARFFYTRAVEVDDSRHVIEKNLRLAEAAGARPGPAEFPLAPVDSAVLDAVRAADPAPFVLLNCGAAWPNKRWPPDRLGRIAVWLRETHGLRSVVLWGPGEEAIAAAVVDHAAGAAVAAPPTSLHDLVALARAARLMVSGDTGPTHIAAAVGTPIVALFGPTSAGRNGPWRAQDITLSRYDVCVCHYQRQCRQPDRWCLASIDEASVRQAIDERLNRE